MADPVIRLDAEQLSVAPGGQTRVGVVITNPGTVVDGYRLEVVGPVAGWARLEPSEISVYPQQDGASTLVVQPPPGTAVLGGRHGFGVVARSTLDPRASATAEGSVEVSVAGSVQAVIGPVNSSGGWQARHRVVLTNTANAVTRLRIEASDPDDTLGFRVTPADVTLPPGGGAEVDVRVMAKKPFLWRSSARHAFRVTGLRADVPNSSMGPPPQFVADGAFNQRPSGWLLLIPAVLVLLAVLSLISPWIVSMVARSPEAATPSLAPLGAPPKPTGLKVTAAGPTSIAVRWDPMEGMTYRLDEVDLKSGDVRNPTPYTANSGIVPNLQPSTEYCFQVHAVRNGLTGPPSNPACAKTPAPPVSQSPSAPATVDPDQPVLTAVYGTVTLDGATGDWPWGNEASVDYPVTKNVSTPVKAKVFLRWDEQAIYVMAQVNDSRLTQSPDGSTIWRGDAVTLELGPERPTQTQTPLRLADRYYMFGYRTPPQFSPFTAPAAKGVLRPLPSFTAFGPALDPTLITAVIAPNPDGGYLLEARIPWPFSQPPTTGMKLAANVNVSDVTQASKTAMISTNPQRFIDQEYPAFWQKLMLG